jgi:hypothetical protein
MEPKTTMATGKLNLFKSVKRPVVTKREKGTFMLMRMVENFAN